MKKVSFIGGYDKFELITYIANVLAKMNNRVLVLDTTRIQKAKYVVPTVGENISYITEFQGFDVGVGFRSIQKLSEYLGSQLQYDVVLIDIDTPQAIRENALLNSDLNYFVTSFDTYSLKRGMEIIDGIENPLDLTRIFYAAEYKKEDLDYFNFLSTGKKAVWKDEIIYFPQENGDYISMTNNQKLQKIKFSNMSKQFKDNVAYIVKEILGETKDTYIKTIIKKSE